MPNHKSTLKRIRQNEVRKARNKYVHKTTRNALKKLRVITVKKDATALLPSVLSLLDNLAKKKIIHRKKASNLKSKATLYVNKLS